MHPWVITGFKMCCRTFDHVSGRDGAEAGTLTRVRIREEHTDGHSSGAGTVGYRMTLM